MELLLNPCQAWVEDGQEVWRLATVRSVSSDGSTIYVLDKDGEPE